MFEIMTHQKNTANWEIEKKNEEKLTRHEEEGGEHRVGEEKGKVE